MIRIRMGAEANTVEIVDDITGEGFRQDRRRLSREEDRKFVRNLVNWYRGYSR